MTFYSDKWWQRNSPSSRWGQVWARPPPRSSGTPESRSRCRPPPERWRWRELQRDAHFQWQAVKLQIINTEFEAAEKFPHEPRWSRTKQVAGIRQTENLRWPQRNLVCSERAQFAFSCRKEFGVFRGMKVDYHHSQTVPVGALHKLLFTSTNKNTFRTKQDSSLKD